MKIALAENRTSGRNFDQRYLIGTHEFYIRTDSEFILPQPGELLVAASLLLAMHKNERISLMPPLTVAPSFSRSLGKVQNICGQWNPSLKTVDLEATCASVQKEPGRVAATFSGGVDSLHTFLVHKEQITDLVFLSRFEPSGSDAASASAEARTRAFAETFGKNVAVFDINGRPFAAESRVSWRFLHGPILAGIGLSSRCERILISASSSYRMMHPWGTHPLIDPLWSTDETVIEHVGHEVTRVGKTAAIANEPDIYRHLQVCWRSNDKNCGSCSKCVRTALALHLLGAAEGPIPLLGVEEKVKSWVVVENGGAEYAFELLLLARETGANRIADLLRRKLDQYVRRRAFHEAGRQLLGKRLTRLLRPKRDWQSVDVLLPDPLQFEG